MWTTHRSSSDGLRAQHAQSHDGDASLPVLHGGSLFEQPFGTALTAMYSARMYNHGLHVQL